MNKNKEALIEIMQSLMKNDPMYADVEMQKEIQVYILACIEGISRSAWISSRRSADLVRQICQSYVSALDNPPPKIVRKSKFS